MDPSRNINYQRIKQEPSGKQSRDEGKGELPTTSTNKFKKKVSLPNPVPPPLMGFPMPPYHTVLPPSTQAMMYGQYFYQQGMPPVPNPPVANPQNPMPQMQWPTPYNYQLAKAFNHRPGASIKPEIRERVDCYESCGSSTDSYDYSLSGGSSLSYDTETTKVEHKHSPIHPDLKDFAIVVGSLALKLPPCANNRVPTKLIDWKQVAIKFPGMTPTECQHLWEQAFSDHKVAAFPQGMVIVCGSTLRNGVIREAASSKPEVSRSDLVNGKRKPGEDSQSSSQRRKKSKRVRLSKAEEAMVERLQKVYGNKWTYIAEQMNTGKTGIEIKNYWHNLQHKIALKLLREQKEKQG